MGWTSGVPEITEISHADASEITCRLSTVLRPTPAATLHFSWRSVPLHVSSRKRSNGFQMETNFCTVPATLRYPE